MKYRQSSRKIIKLKTNSKKFILIFLIVSVFLFTKIIFGVSISESGKKLSDIELEEERLKSESSILKEKISEMSSLNFLSRLAKDMGFTDPEKIIYITEEGYLASLK